jgi:hypothetical protein
MLAIRTILIAMVVSGGAAPALAQRADEALVLAMENYDLGDYAAADAALRAVLARGDLATETLVRAHVLRAVVLANGSGDVEAAAAELEQALMLDPAVTLPAAYRADAIDEALAMARDALAAKRPRPPGCDELVGIAHQPLGSAEAHLPLAISARVGPALRTAALTVHLRREGGAWERYPMTATAECAVGVAIPAASVSPGALAYYITADNAAGRALATRGSEAAPIIIAIAAPATAATTELATRPGAEDEVPAALRAAAPRRGRGCAGCAASDLTSSAPGLLCVVSLAMWPRRRRRRAARRTGGQ